jgi:hypothetical protein
MIGLVLGGREPKLPVNGTFSEKSAFAYIVKE